MSRAVLMPSLWRESFGRVAAEALANGLPMLASDRSAARTAREVLPWLATIERLWDDPAWEAAQRERAREAATRWDDDAVLDRYLALFGRLAAR